MLRRLRIEHFRGFSELLAELSPISVLLGPNSCGKSSVLQAVRFACAALSWTMLQEPEPKMDGDWIVLWWNWPVDGNVAFLPALRIEDLFHNQGGEPLSVTLSFDHTDPIQELKVSLGYGRNAALKLDVRVKSRSVLESVGATKAKSKFFSPRLVEALAGKEPIAVSIPAFYGVVREEPYVNDARLEKLLAAGEQGSVVRNLISRLGSLKELSDFLRDSVNAEMVRSTSGQDIQQADSLSAYFKDNNGDLELSAAGTGLVALTALYSALKWYSSRAGQGRSLLFLLDEPEAHLHPLLQGKTGERIADLMQSFGAQALLATHSVEMINRLGLRKDTVLLNIDRRSSQAAIPLRSENELMERLDSFCDLSPFAGLQLLRSKRIVFHEGKSDAQIIKSCARAKFSNQPSSEDRIRRWTFAELSGVSNADAKNVLRAAIAPLMSSIKDNTGPFYMVRILDRDYHRTPVMGPDQIKDNISEFDVVWPRHSIESLFLDPQCLGAWLFLSLRGYPGAPSQADLEQWVAEGIQLANKNNKLNEEAFDQIFPVEYSKLPPTQADSPQHFKHLKQQVMASIEARPEELQQGKARAKFILDHVRQKLPASLHNKVRRDIPELIKHTPNPSTLLMPALVPPVIHFVLQYLASVPE